MPAHQVHSAQNQNGDKQYRRNYGKPATHSLSHTIWYVHNSFST